MSWGEIRSSLLSSLFSLDFAVLIAAFGVLRVFLRDVRAAEERDELAP